VGFQRHSLSSSTLDLRRFQALYTGRFDEVRTALNCRTDVNAPTSNLGTEGQTLLHAAARAGNEEVVKLLLVSGAEIDGEDALGFTSLHEAVRRGHKEVAKLLLARLANSSRRTKSGRTAWDLASNNEVLELLRHHHWDLLYEYQARDLPQHGFDLAFDFQILGPHHRQPMHEWLVDHGNRKLISDLITKSVYFKDLKRKGFGRTEQRRGRTAFLVSAFLLRSFGARLKTDANNAKQRALAGYVIAQLRQIAFDIECMDNFETVEVTPDPYQESRVAAFLKSHMPQDEVLDHILPEVPSLRDVDIDRVPDMTSHLAEELRGFMTSSRASMELHVSLRRMAYANVLDAIDDEISRALTSDIQPPHAKLQFQVTSDLDWDLYRFVVNEIEGEMGMAGKAHILWSVVTVTGDVERAWATTCKDYMTSQWPVTSQAVMEAVRNSMVMTLSTESGRTPNARYTVWSGRIPRKSRVESGTSNR
jgi:Ankyrin repeats (3 copies)